MDIEGAVERLGGVAHASQLQPFGLSALDVRTARRAGRLMLVRRGWVALPNASAEVVSAVRVGGSLSCLSALRRRGVWCVDDGLLHVRVDRHANHLSSADDRAIPFSAATSRRIKLHRVPVSAIDARFTALDRIEDALMQMVLCQPRDHAVAAVDSALRLKLTDRVQLQECAGRLSQKHRDVVSLANADAASGLETKARLRLRALRIPYRTQVYVPRVGHVDLVVGDRLVVELDGREWHSTEAAFAEDRRRDLILNERGHAVIRLTYAQTMYEWDRVEAVIRRFVATREHRWSAAHRRNGLGGSR